MGKAEVGTPKYLANKMKAKGLQKLRWYCQMCQKQCRDENGFKCHVTSESHQRQILLFAENSGQYIHSFSKEFADGYLELLRRRFGTKRVSANKVYQEYISHKDHLHMNATKWLTLSDFVKWMGRAGHAAVDETEKGWFVTYIDRSPEVLEQQEKLARREKQDKDDEDRLQEHIQQQIERGKQEAKNGKQSTEEITEFKKENDDDIIKIELKSLKMKKDLFLLPQAAMSLTEMMATKRAASSKSTTTVKEEPIDEDDNDSESTNAKRSKYSAGSRSGSCTRSIKEEQPKRLTALDEIMKNEEDKKEKINRKDYWITEGIIVKLITKSIGDKYYKQKAHVLEVIDRYQAKIKLIETGEKLKVDQTHCETVIPAIGKCVRILNGGYRGCTAILKSIEQNTFTVTLEISAGTFKGRIIHNIQYEDISKIYE